MQIDFVETKEGDGAGDIKVYETGRWYSLKRHLRAKAVGYGGLVVGLFLLITAVVLIHAVSGGNGGGVFYDEDVVCTECLQGEPDDCGLIPFSFRPFSMEIQDPRNYKLQYIGGGERRLEAGTRPETVFRALLGDRTARSESLFFRWVRYAISSQSTKIFHTSKTDAYRPTINAMISMAQDYLESKRALNDSLPQSYTDDDFNVVCATEYAMNNFWYNQTKAQIVELYLSYASLNFDNLGGFEVWSTIYQEIASFYGTSVSVYKPDPSRRTLDLNLWNLKRNGIFLKREGAYPDTGEFVSPGWRYASEFAGLILHPPRTTPKNSSLPVRYDPIVFAFFGISYNNASYVLVLDGHMINGSLSYCIEQEDDGHFYHCEFPPWEYYVPYPAFPTNLREKYRAIGFIAACSSDDRGYCKPPKGLFDKYRSTTSQFTIPQNIVDYIYAAQQWRATTSNELMTLHFYGLNSTAVVGPQSEVDLF